MSENNEKKTEEKNEEQNLWDSLDTVMLRAKKILGKDMELPKDTETLETGLFKIIMAMNSLCDKIEKPNLIIPKGRKLSI